MAVTKRKEAERAIVRIAAEVNDTIAEVIADTQRALNDDLHPSVEARLENQVIDLASLHEAINLYRKLPRRAIDSPDVAVRDDAGDTSRLAARKIMPRHGTLRRTVYDQIAMREQGLSDLELEALLGLSHQTVSSARNSLVENGWVVDSGERRPFKSSRVAIVWKVAS